MKWLKACQKERSENKREACERGHKTCFAQARQDVRSALDCRRRRKPAPETREQEESGFGNHRRVREREEALSATLIVHAQGCRRRANLRSSDGGGHGTGTAARDGCTGPLTSRKQAPSRGSPRSLLGGDCFCVVGFLG